jgi:3-hydroxyisobutyrate dehydrogenase-like beta-hydroxyacid dehydrogenase
VTTFAIVGHGELGATLARGLAERGAEVRVASQRGRPVAEVVPAADVVIACVPLAAAADVLADTLPHLRRGAVYADPAPLPPARKAEAARVVEERGALYADVAVVGTAAADGYEVPLLVAGQGAAPFCAAAHAAGLVVTEVEGAAGAASRVKLLRSVFLKGRDALVLEMLLAARRHGVEEALLESFSGAGERVAFRDLATRIICSLTLHAERRADELALSEELLSEVGVEPVVTLAARERLEWLAALRLRERFDRQRPTDLRHVLAAIDELERNRRP